MSYYSICKRIFVLFLLLSSAPTGTVSAQNPVANNANLKTYGCINAVLCNDEDAELHKNLNCPGPNNGSDQGTWPHRTRVFNTTPLEPNADIYLTECLNTTEGLICTTGSSRLDKELFCGDPNASNPMCDHYSLLKNKPHGYRMIPDWHESDYSIYYSDNYSYASAQDAKRASTTMVRTTAFDERKALKTDANGRLPITEWQIHTRPETSRIYVAFQIVAPTPTPTPIAGNSPTPVPGIGGQQQATLSFDPATTPPPGGACDTVTFDPYGRIFDAVSLEPIPQASVRLLQMDPNSGQFSLQYAQSRSFINVNPQPSFVDGGFSFLVEDGDYKLEPVFNGYVFGPQAAVTLGANVGKIYSDLYFSDSPAIQQRGAIEHRDIPMQPIDGLGKAYDLQIVAQHQEAVVKNGTQMMRFSGRVSHPFAKADVFICENRNNSSTETCNPYQSFVASNGGPDEYGVFSFEIEQTEVSLGQRFRVDFVKQDLAQTIVQDAGSMNRIAAWIRRLLGQSIVQAADSSSTTSQYIEPIIAYIEGHAYDTQGKILPSARVDITIPFATRPVYTTYADNTGYFRITSEHVPKSTYSITYLADSSNPSSITTSQFLAQNTEFIVSEEIDPMKFVTEKSNPRRFITPQFVAQSQISPIVSEVPAKIDNSISAAETPSNPLYLVGAILLFLLGGAGALLAVYMYKKKSNKTEE